MNWKHRLLIYLTIWIVFGIACLMSSESREPGDERLSEMLKFFAVLPFVLVMGVCVFTGAPPWIIYPSLFLVLLHGYFVFASRRPAVWRGLTLLQAISAAAGVCGFHELTKPAG